MEIRAIHPTRDRKDYPTVWGFFDGTDLSRLIEAIVDLNGKGY